MDMKSRKQYLKTLQKEYLGASRGQKGSLLDEAEKRTGLERKYIIARLSPKTHCQPKPKAPRSVQYGANLLVPLVAVWEIFDQPCGQRLVPLMVSEVERLRRFGELVVTDAQAGQLRRISARTVDRLLRHEKQVRLLNHKAAAKKHPLLYQQIPTKMSHEWDRDKPGQIQIDGVEHCGQSTSGQYLSTISHTDIGFGWWEGEAVMGTGQRFSLVGIKAARQRFPVPWIEIHPDNGVSFINRFLYDYALATQLTFSRSRPYQKNDNCWVEQKNSTHVRQVVGHLRYDTEAEQTILNDLYRGDFRLYKNFFQPVMKLASKEREKGHVRRRYDKPQTPYHRLLASDQVTEATKIALTEVYDSLNPAELKRRIDAKLKLLYQVYAAKHPTAEPAKDKRQTPRSGKVFI